MKNKTQKNRKSTGGRLVSNPILKKIISIGFEFETGNMTPLEYSNSTKKIYMSDVKARKIEPSEEEKQKLSDANITKLTIVSDKDTPSMINPKESLIANLNERFLNEPAVGHFLEQSKIDVYSRDTKIPDNYNFYYHTEYIFTFFSDSINDNDVILKYFGYVLNYLMTCFEFVETKMDSTSDLKLSYFKNKYYPRDDKFIYLIPMRTTQSFIPQTIQWVPQMTINIKVVDIIVVLPYLIKSTEYSKEVDTSIKELDFIKIRYNELGDSENKIKINKIYDILKNVFFVLIYIIKSKETKDEDDFRKNEYTFLFRCPLVDIIIGLYKKYDIEIVNFTINLFIEKLQSNIQQKSFEILYDFLRFVLSYDGKKTNITNKFLEDNITSEEIDLRFIYFTEIFGSGATYYPYDAEKETILIEYRSFSQNLLKESKHQGNVYKTLNEWSEMLGSITGTRMDTTSETIFEPLELFETHTKTYNKKPSSRRSRSRSRDNISNSKTRGRSRRQRQRESRSQNREPRGRTRYPR